MRAGPDSTVSASPTLPSSTCDRLYWGWSPRRTSTFARLRSASSSITSRRSSPSETARLTATFVLPTPPLPLVTATTLTGSRLSARSMSASWLGLRMGHARLSVVLGHRALVDPCRARVQALDRAVDEPQAPALRRVQVVRDALPVGQPDGREVVADQGAEDAAELRGFVDPGDHRAGERQRAEAAHGLVEAGLLARRREREIKADPPRLAPAGGEALGEAGVALAQALGVDQHQPARPQAVQHGLELVGLGRRVHFDADDAGESLEVLARADAPRVRAHERHALRAVAHHPVRGELGNRGRLADAGGTDERRRPAGGQELVGGDRNRLRELR